MIMVFVLVLSFTIDKVAQHLLNVHGTPVRLCPHNQLEKSNIAGVSTVACTLLASLKRLIHQPI
jgi:hypothetical protein